MSNKLEWIVGPVHTGKTTRLAEKIAANPDRYCGILAIVDDKGNRYLKDIISGIERKLDCAINHPGAITVGPYFFDNDVFKWGQKILKQHNENYSGRIIVIDEIGKLELRDAGLSPTCWEIISTRQFENNQTIIIVRDSLEIDVKIRIDNLPTYARNRTSHT